MALQTRNIFTIAVYLQWVLWAAYTALICFFIYVCRQTPKFKDYTSGSPGVKPTTIAIYVMYLFASAHVALTYPAYIEVVNAPDFDPSPLVFAFSSSRETTDVVRDVLYITNMIIGDSLLVWRLFVVWKRGYRVSAFPALIVLLTAAAGYGAIGRDLLLKSLPIMAGTWYWIAGMFGASLLTNVIVTLLIAGRIWYQAQPFVANYRRMLLVVLESGSIMAIGKILELCLYSIKGNTWYIMYFCMAQITGIVPLTIVIAVATGFTHTATTAAEIFC